MILRSAHSEVEVVAADGHIPARERRIDGVSAYSAAVDLSAGRGPSIDDEAFFTERVSEGRGWAGRRAYPEPESAVRDAYKKPIEFPASAIFWQPYCAASSDPENFFKTSKHIHALEMATFNPISYKYVPTVPRSKSALSRPKPGRKQSSIFDKTQHAKPNGAALGSHRPAAAVEAADDNGGYRSGSRGMSRDGDGLDYSNGD